MTTEQQILQLLQENSREIKRLANKLDKMFPEKKKQRGNGLSYTEEALKTLRECGYNVDDKKAA